MLVYGGLGIDFGVALGSYRVCLVGVVWVWVGLGWVSGLAWSAWGLGLVEGRFRAG